MKLDFSNDEIKRHMLEGGFGLEKESLRTCGDGFLSRAHHPFPNDKNLDRDFAESQTEFITDVFDSAAGACGQLEELHRRAYREMRSKGYDEYFWAFSNPPYITDEDDISVAEFDGEHKGKSAYRRYLAEKYGKRKMLYSGVHFNFNFSDAFLGAAYAGSDFVGSKNLFREKLYLDLSAKAAEYSWLIVYLMSASPVFDGSFFGGETGTSVVSEFSSARCGKAGYWNNFYAVLDYSSLENYAASINRYVSDGRLRSASELYCPVRIKPNGENSLDNLLKKGVGHIEFRLLDLNPFSPTGVVQKDIEFIQLFFVYLLSIESGEFGEHKQINAVKNAQKAAMLDDGKTEILTDTGYIGLKAAAENLLDDITVFYTDIAGKDTVGVLNYQKRKLVGKSRYADIAVRDFSENYVESGIRLARKHAQYFEEK